MDVGQVLVFVMQRQMAMSRTGRHEDRALLVVRIAQVDRMAVFDRLVVVHLCVLRRGDVATTIGRGHVPTDPMVNDAKVPICRSALPRRSRQRAQNDGREPVV